MFSTRSATQEAPGPETAPAGTAGPHVLPKPTDQCDACPAKVQVVVTTARGPFGFCVHHGRKCFDQLMLAGLNPSRPQHIGDIGPWTYGT
jgi:hypothetical protein